MPSFGKSEEPVIRTGVVVIGSGPRDVLIQGNRIHHNNTEDFDAGWEAGGVKATEARRLTMADNEVYDNNGAGLWCDINCAEVVISNNRIHDNANTGIHFEISDGAKIFRNAVWENGWDYDDWGWGAGILVSTSRDVEAYENVVAWNGDGISVVEQDRGRDHSVTNVHIYDNVIVSTADRSRFGLAWLSDHKPYRMHSSGSNNRGERNAYCFSGPEHDDARFSWRDELSSLSDFNKTPGGRNGRYLSASEMDEVLSAAGIPTTPERR